MDGYWNKLVNIMPREHRGQISDALLVLQYTLKLSSVLEIFSSVV